MDYEELLGKYNELLDKYIELENENKELKLKLGVDLVKQNIEASSGLNQYSTKEEKLQFYMSLFKGRKDVYARRWERRSVQ